MVETGLNYQGIPTLENAAYEFETDTWGKLLVISLEFPQEPEGLGVDDVEAAAPIHQDLGEPDIADNGVDDERVFPGLGT